MCGRFAIAQSLAAILAAFNAQTALDGFAPVFNAAPQMKLPLVIKNRVGLGEWGYANPGGARPLFNARAETVDEKQSFAPSWQAGRRCIVPASGFYEWDGAKNPWFVGLEGHALIGFAGLWLKNGKDVRFTILTRPAEPALRQIHERMPVMLAPAQAHDWFAAPPADARAMTLHAPIAPPISHRVGKAVGNVRNNSAGLMLPAPTELQPPEQVPGDRSAPLQFSLA